MKVGIIMGSKSDKEYADAAVGILKDFQIDCEVKVISAHRNPQGLKEFTEAAVDNGFKVLIGIAGGSAALPGALASWTTLPIIGVPVGSSALGGIDSLLSIAQMPPGIPVASMAVGQWGARNAALYAIQILALTDKKTREKYEKYRESLRAK